MVAELCKLSAQTQGFVEQSETDCSLEWCNRWEFSRLVMSYI